MYSRIIIFCLKYVSVNDLHVSKNNVSYNAASMHSSMANESFVFIYAMVVAMNFSFTHLLLPSHNFFFNTHLHVYGICEFDYLSTSLYMTPFDVLLFNVI